MDTFIHDVRLALRSARRRPVFMLVAVGSLAVGVAATTIMFAVVDTIFLRPIPGVDVPARLVEVGLTRRGTGFGLWDYPDFVDMLAESERLEGAAMFATGRMSISDDASSARLRAMYVSSGYFAVVGAEPGLGRSFVPREDMGPGEHPVAILGHSLWQDRFGGDPTVLGSTLRLNRETYTVVGVSREDFVGHRFGADTQVFVPITQHPLARANAELFASDRSVRWAGVLGRLRTDSSVEEVNAALATIFARFADTYRVTNDGISARAAGSKAPGPPPSRRVSSGLRIGWSRRCADSRMGDPG